MAAADYHLCHLCGRKAFYDANVTDDRYLAHFGIKTDPPTDPIGIAVLCTECNKTHEAIIQHRALREKSDG